MPRTKNLPDRECCPKLKAIGMVIGNTDRDGKSSDDPLRHD